MSDTRKTWKVDLGARSYDIHIGAGLLAQAPGLLPMDLAGRRVFILADRNVKAHQEILCGALEGTAAQVDTLLIEGGEPAKSYEGLQHVLDWLLEGGVERSSVLFALGGGVIGDLGGFAASAVLRGIPFVQVPTTLLAQVDSSVGGKTGINSVHGKNLIGAFHQPSLVLADIGVLDSLPARDFLSGYGEVVKYGLLGDAAFFDWLEANGPALARGDRALRQHAVRRSVEMKARIIERDETEEGDRALLNLGHTFCHALETATGYSDRLLHGEGVAIGCALAFETSQRLGLCSQEAPSRVRAHLKAMGMKCDIADIPGDLPDADALMALMAQDKKVVDGKLRFILARAIGEAFVTADVDAATVRQVIAEALAARR